MIAAVKSVDLRDAFFMVIVTQLFSFCKFPTKNARENLVKMCVFHSVLWNFCGYSYVIINHQDLWWGSVASSCYARGAIFSL